MPNSGVAENRGVLLVVDYHSHLTPAVEVAIALAHRSRLALRGLYIEDPDLSSVCSLPFSQEVTMTGARPRALEAEHLGRTLARFNRRFQQLLSQGAERASLEYSFDSVHGRRDMMLHGVEMDSDYLVLGQPQSRGALACKRLRVLLVDAQIQSALPVLESLRADNGGRELDLLLVSREGDGGQDSLLQAFAAEHRGVSLQRVPVSQLAALFRSTGQAPALVVTSRQCRPEMLQTLLKLAPCPVIVSSKEGDSLLG